MRMFRDVEIAPHSQCVVTGVLKKGINGCTMLIQSVLDDEKTYSIPYTVSRVNDDKVLFRVLLYKQATRAFHCGKRMIY